ncbi:MAG: LysM peptidoglycan-binding domain-containing protein [Anaerocolumna sp.]
MIIHIVQPGETIDSIANYYDINKERLIFDNDIINPDNLADGQTILIVYPHEVYVVKEGDTVSSIAQMYDITVQTLVRNNSFLLDREVLIGETLVISYNDEKTSSFNVNGYAYPYINRDILRKNLLYLTYLSIFSYSIKSDGTLTEIDDDEVIAMAKSFGVAPIMVISGEGTEETISLDFYHDIINSEEAVVRVIEQAIKISTEKGYYAVNLDVPYIRTEDRDAFVHLIRLFSMRLHEYNIKFFITITPDSFGDQDIPKDILVQDYSNYGNIADEIVLLAYSWGYTSEIPLNAVPTSIQEILLQLILEVVPKEKISVGFSSIGYITEFPPTKGDAKASSISVSNAIELAGQSGATIEFNQSNQSSYFFVTQNDVTFFVYFHDIRGVDYQLSSLDSYGIDGVAIWNVMYYLAQTFFLINTQYHIMSATDVLE